MIGMYKRGNKVLNIGDGDLFTDDYFLFKKEFSYIMKKRSSL